MTDIKNNLLLQLKEDYSVLFTLDRRLSETQGSLSYLTKDEFNELKHVAHLFNEQMVKMEETLRMLRVYGIPYHEAMASLRSD